MELTPEQVLAELRQIATRLSELEVDAPERTVLESRRAGLRTAAHATKLNEALDEANRLDREAVEARIEQLKKALKG